MSDYQPPLTALRSFEAAARHMSFAKAADELHVTPAALSYQIRSLEDQLGRPVFRHLNRAVELTDLGRQLFPAVTEAFSALNIAWRSARRAARATGLTVTAGPAFTAKWLSSRLFDFAEKNPEIELRFVATTRVMDFARDGIDVAIRLATRPDPGFFSRTLIQDWFTPMMAPSLAAKLRQPSDLALATLLHCDGPEATAPAADWRAWFRAAGLGAEPRTGPRFSRADHAIDAAITGAGVVLGQISLAVQSLRQGLLVAPFRTALTTGADHRLICPSDAERPPQTATFHDWICAETSHIEYFGSGRDFVRIAEAAA